MTVLIPLFEPPQLNHVEVQQLQTRLADILATGMLTDRRYCRRFEGEVKRLYHVDHAFVAPSATVALDILTKIINSPTVYSPAFTWKSLLSVFFGRTTEWLDIDKHTWLPMVPKNPSQNSLIIYNHTFGNIGTIDQDFNYTLLVYDGAQAFGAEIKDFGDATVFGFAPTKPVTCGEGGMIVTNNDRLAKLIQEKHQHNLLRMSEINAAVGLTYLQKLPEVQRERRKIGDYYRKHLPYPSQEVHFSHSQSVFGILVSEREKLIKKIKDKMQYRVYYEPLARGLENTEWVYERILCIPNYAGCPYKEVVELLS